MYIRKFYLTFIKQIYTIIFKYKLQFRSLFTANGHKKVRVASFCELKVRDHSSSLTVYLAAYQIVIQNSEGVRDENHFCDFFVTFGGKYNIEPLIYGVLQTFIKVNK